MMTAILANAGVPMLAIEWPLMWLALIPVILIETAITQRQLNFKYVPTLKAVAVANLVSTAIGIPLSWGGMVIINMLSGGGGGFGVDTWAQRIATLAIAASWLAPYEGDLHWLIPAALCVLLIPAFFASGWIEYWVCRAFWKNSDRKQVSSAIWKANLASYCLLLILGLLWLGLALLLHP